MRLRVFRAEKGDCLLASDDKKRHILIDGGMKRAFAAHVAPFLGRMRKRKEKLDLVYVSHVDQDHISGVLKMMDDEIEWRVHDFQKKSGNAAHKKPTVPRPPKVRSIWHNAFHEQLGKNSGPIEDMLAATATVLSGDESEKGQDLSESLRNLAASNREAIRLS
ncbi:MAG: MBL fold metallo-hydrolase, partial [Planctomycetota bacterium]